MKSDIEKKSNRKLYSIHSQKGGVGKTSVALAIAGFESIYNKHKVIFIDADLTGTCIKDALEFDWNDKNNKFLNKLLLGNPEEFKDFLRLGAASCVDGNKSSVLETFFSKMKGDVWDNLYFISSSARLKDVCQVIPLVSQEDYLHFFSYRMEELIYTLYSEYKFDVVIIDLPPGFYGFSKNICDVLLENTLTNCRYAINREPENRLAKLAKFYNLPKHNEELTGIDTETIFVSSSDKPDYRSVVPLIADYLENFYEESKVSKKMKFCTEKQSVKPQKSCMKLLLNKMNLEDENSRSPEKFYGKIIQDLYTLNIKDKENVSKSESFVYLVITLIEKMIEKVGSLYLQDCKGFKVDQILPVLKKLYKNEPSLSNNMDYGPMEKWCIDIGKIFGFIRIQP